MEVRRDSSVRRGVALGPLALPPAWCMPDHRKEGLRLEKKRGAHHIKLMEMVQLATDTSQPI